jgi:hypothetical protein
VRHGCGIGFASFTAPKIEAVGHWLRAGGGLG